MIRTLVLLSSFLITNISIAQFHHSDNDSLPSFLASRSLFTPNYIVTEGNLTYSEFSAADFVRSEILKLESQEADALKKRDTLSLRKIWSRDFSLDDTLTNRIIEDKRGLPYYVTFYRTVEDVRAVGELVYTNGYDLVQTLSIYDKLKQPVKRNFRHVWARSDGSWKLISKTK
jgi:hypothetical protein